MFRKRISRGELVNFSSTIDTRRSRTLRLQFMYNLDYSFTEEIRKSEIFATFEKIHDLFPNKFTSKESKYQIKAILLILIVTTANLLHVNYINIASYETLGKIKIPS